MARVNSGSTWRRGASAVINSQLATVDLLVLKCFKALRCAFHINEICVCETSWLASASVDGYSDINDIADIAEELVEISIRHLECKVANEQGLAGWVVDSVALGLRLVVHNQSAAFENTLVLGLNGGSSLRGAFEFDISESAGEAVSYD